MRMPVSAAIVAALALAGCQQQRAQNWLTAPDRTQHAVYFTIDAGGHAKLDCAGCHGGFDTFALFDCLSCHAASQTDPIHATMAGYARESGACYSCHQSGSTIDPQTHAKFFPLTHGISHGTVDCGSCHVDPADRKAVDCTTCHEHDEATLAPKHASVDGWRWSDKACLRCHDDGHVNPVAAHAAFPVASGGHATTYCLDCHTAPQAAKPWTQDFGTFDCLTCHAAAETDPKHAGVAGYTRTSSACLGCHEQGGAVDPAAHAAFFPIAAGTPHTGAVCSGCHVDPANRKTIGCTSCHATTPMSTAHASVGGYSSTRCIACHAESQVDRLADHRPFVITSGGHARRSCFQCHPTMRADKPWAVSFAGVDCLGCHGRTSMDSRHAGRSGYSWTTSACLRCHPSGRGG